MKKIIFLGLFGFIMSCQLSRADIPANAQACGNDGQCPDGFYCGFYGVDTTAVCKPD